MGVGVGVGVGVGGGCLCLCLCVIVFFFYVLNYLAPVGYFSVSIIHRTLTRVQNKVPM